MLALAATSTVVGLAPIHLSRMILDAAIPRRDTDLLAVLVACLAVVVVALAVLGYARAMLGRRIQELFVMELRARLMGRIISLPAEYFAANPIGKLTNRVMHDVNRFGMGIDTILVTPVTTSATLLAYLAYLLSIDPLLTAVALVPLPFLLFITSRLTTALGRRRSATLEAHAAYSASMNEIMLSAAEIQANGTFARELRRIELDQDALSSASLREASLLARLGAASDAYRGAVPVLVYAWGGLLAILDERSVGQVVAFAATFGGLYVAIDAAIQYAPIYLNVRDRYAELQRLLEVRGVGRGPLVFEVREADWVGRPGTELSLEGVSFAHVAGAKVLDSIDLRIRSGEHVALVGRSGCGKSTLLNVVAGRLDPVEGRMVYDETPYADLTHERRAGRISHVGQTATLFAGPLRENLTYGILDEGARARVEDAELVRACAKTALSTDLLLLGLQASVPEADAARFIAVRRVICGALGEPEGAAVDSRWRADASIRENLLPEGFDVDDIGRMRDASAALVMAVTDAGLAPALRELGLGFDVGERGSRLSGGQRQKVAIARALLRRRPLLLLDEVTASLDEASARAIMQLLGTELRGTTVVAITHELEDVASFDRIVALKDGRVVADLAPAELVADEGLRTRIFQ